ncbi:MAG: response regulator [Casimicrobiaceae bacterium]
MKVLIVDDNRDLAESTALLLRMLGCDVEVAFDGKVALESVVTIKPDAVLLDIGLPGMSGYEVAEHIRADPKNAHTILVAVSGYGEDEHQARSKQAGFDHHLVKPIDPMTLPDLLASIRAPSDTRH